MVVFAQFSDRAIAAERPNIIVVLADDLGYGDVQPLNPDSQIQTPNFGRLARLGVKFTDAHTPSAVCTPTRYGLLTGRYCWRTRLKRGVLNGYGEPLMDAANHNIASVFSDAGYHTAVVGKWHLGLGLAKGESADEVDLSVPLTHHPGTVGFDNSFVIPASLDFPPYAFFQNGKATSSETRMIEASKFPVFYRKGPMASDFKMVEVMDRFVDEASAEILAMGERDKPSLLYVPLPSPHKPVLPAKRFRGKSPVGTYGDYVIQTDDAIGQILDSIEKANIADNTWLFVTSDNGSYMYRYGAGAPDHTTDETIQGYAEDHHRSNGPWRGTKADIWEAGHRVPFFVVGPTSQKYTSKKISKPVGLVDVFSTAVELAGIELPSGASPDGVSFASMVVGSDDQEKTNRRPLILHSASGMFAIRSGRWKYVLGNGSGGREKPKGKPFDGQWPLFDLKADPAETTDVSVDHQDVVKRLRRQFERLAGDDLPAALR